MELDEPPRAVARRRDEEGRLRKALLLRGACDGSDGVVDASLRDERDDGAAEASACHARAEVVVLCVSAGYLQLPRALPPRP